MRTLGAKNKPKFGSIKLSLLCGYLQPDSLIPVDIKFLQAIKSANGAINFESIKECPTETKEDKIEMLIS